MLNLKLVLMMVGLILLILAGFNVQAPRTNLVALGLACWLLAVLVSI